MSDCASIGSGTFHRRQAAKALGAVCGSVARVDPGDRDLRARQLDWLQEASESMT
jgi:hypothetical protein